MLQPTAYVIPFFHVFISASEHPFCYGALACVNIHSIPGSAPKDFNISLSRFLIIFFNSLDAPASWAPLYENKVDGYPLLVIFKKLSVLQLQVTSRQIALVTTQLKITPNTFPLLLLFTSPLMIKEPK